MDKCIDLFNSSLVNCFPAELTLLEEILKVYEVSENSGGCGVISCTSTLNHKRGILVAPAVYLNLQIIPMFPLD